MRKVQGRAAIIRDAKEEAKEIMSTANAKIERAILEIRQAEAEKARTKEIRNELEDYRRSLNDETTADRGLPEELKPLKHRSQSSKYHQKKTVETNKVTIEIGSHVRMSDGSVIGKVISMEGKKAEVAFGSLRTRVPVSKLVIAKAPKDNTTTVLSASTYNDSRERQLKFRQELDIRGMRGDEALQALTYFLDDAMQFSASRVRILHGTGHGILRELVRQQLRAIPGVKSYADEDVRFGGAGITVVELA